MHVRNEEHASGYHYEDWVVDEKNSSTIDSILNSTPVIPYSTVLANPGYPELGGLPVSRLFDTDNYNGLNPSVTTGADIGLAEYTNANYFARRSADSYTYPRDAAFREYTGLDPAGTKKRLYYAKDGDGDAVEHIAAVAYFDYDLKRRDLQPLYDNFIFLDENCYKDYATNLLPRAAGYAFSLMQYFFRGEVEAVGAMAVKNGNSDITGMTMKVRNKTPKVGGSPGEIEPIGGGQDDKVIVSYEYKNGGATVYGKSDPLAFNNNTSYTYQFTNFTQPIPSDATDKKFLLVYRGTLGEEDDAVAGKSFDVGEGDIYFSGSHQETFYFNQSAVIVYRVNRTTGNVEWKYYWSILGDCTEYSGPHMSDDVLHAVSNDAVYVSWYVLYECPDDNTDAWYIDKLDKDTGNLIWRVREGGDYTETINLASDSTGAYVMRYFGYQANPPMRLQKYSAEGGGLLWDKPLPDANWSKVKVYADDNGVFYAFTPSQAANTTVVCVEPTTGNAIWSVNVSDTMASSALNYSTYGQGLSVGTNYIVLNTASGFTVLSRSDGGTIANVSTLGLAAAQANRVLNVDFDQGSHYTYEGNFLKTIDLEQDTSHSCYYHRIFPMGMGALRSCIYYPEDGAHSYATYTDDNGNLLWDIELENLPLNTPDPYLEGPFTGYNGYGCLYIGNVTYDATGD